MASTMAAAAVGGSSGIALERSTGLSVDESQIRPTLEGLPWELITAVAIRAGCDATRALAQCCHRLAPIGRDAFLWRTMCRSLFPQVLLDRLDAIEADGARVDWRHHHMSRWCPPRIVSHKGTVTEDGAPNPTEVRIGQWTEPTPGAGFYVCRGVSVIDGTRDAQYTTARDRTVMYPMVTPKIQGDRKESEEARIHAYANGDLWAYRDLGSLGRRTIWFRCSPRHIDWRFAGKLLWQGEWTDHSMVDDSVDGGTVYVFYPIRGRFFHDYVASGLIGWDAATQAAYHRHMDGVGTATLCDTQTDRLLFEGARPLDTVPDIASDDTWRPWALGDRSVTDFGGSWVPHMPRCPLTGNAVPYDTDWAILSNGSVCVDRALCRWFQLLESMDLCARDPLSMEPVVPWVHRVPWWLGGTNPRWMSDAVVRANRRVCTLFADGADMILAGVSATAIVWALVEADMVDAHVRATAGDRRARARREARDADLTARLARGNMCPAIPGIPFDPYASLRAVRVRDVDVPPLARHVQRLDFAIVSAIRACFENVVWHDRLFCDDVLVGASFVGCRFVGCRFQRCIFVDASFVECAFEQCAVYTADEEPVDGPISDSLARLGCFRIVGTTES